MMKTENGLIQVCKLVIPGLFLLSCASCSRVHSVLVINRLDAPISVRIDNSMRDPEIGPHSYGVLEKKIYIGSGVRITASTDSDIILDRWFYKSDLVLDNDLLVVDVAATRSTRR